MVSGCIKSVSKRGGSLGQRVRLFKMRLSVFLGIPTYFNYVKSSV